MSVPEMTQEKALRRACRGVALRNGALVDERTPTALTFGEVLARRIWRGGVVRRI